MSVPVQSIAWKMIYYVSSGTLNPTIHIHSLFTKSLKSIGSLQCSHSFTLIGFCFLKCRRNDNSGGSPLRYSVRQASNRTTAISGYLFNIYRSMNYSYKLDGTRRAAVDDYASVCCDTYL